MRSRSSTAAYAGSSSLAEREASGKERFFYALRTGQADEISQIIEREFERIENLVAIQVDAAVKRLLGGEQIEEGVKWEVAHLMAMIWARGPAMRHQINSMQEQLLRKVMDFAVDIEGVDTMIDRLDRETGKATPADLREGVKELIASGEYKMSFDNQVHLQFLSDVRGWANLFHGQYWNVFINKSGKTFITTDNPVVVVYPERKGFYGPTFLERTHYFALSPEICIQALYPERRDGKKLRRITLFPEHQTRVTGLSFILTSQAQRYVYACERLPLEEILAALDRPAATHASDDLPT